MIFNIRLLIFGNKYYFRKRVFIVEEEKENKAKMSDKHF